MARNKFYFIYFLSYLLTLSGNPSVISPSVLGVPELTSDDSEQKYTNHKET